MSDDAEGRAILAKTMEAYLEERKKFVIGFVNFVLEQGIETLAPIREGKKIRETWRAVGQRLYGMELFEATLAAEVESRRKARAEGRLPDVRSDQVKAGRARCAAEAGQIERGRDHPQQGTGSSTESS